MMPTNYLILCCPLLLLPSIFPNIKVFSNESALCIRWPNTGVSALTSVLPMNTQDRFPLGWSGWISLQSKGLSRVFSNITVQNINSSVLSPLYSPTLISVHDYRKNHSLDQTNIREIKKTLRRCRLKKDLIEARGLHLIMWRRTFSAERRNLQDLCKGPGRV